MENLETQFNKLLTEEERLNSSMADLEDMLYNCLYLFEDAIALTDAYGSYKASELKSILEAVYGK